MSTRQERLKSKAADGMEFLERIHKNNVAAMEKQQDMFNKAMESMPKTQEDILLRIPGGHLKPYYFVEITHRQMFELEAYAEDNGLGSLRDAIAMLLKKDRTPRC